MIYIYPILIGASKVGVIWVKNKTLKKVFMTSTQIFILVAILELKKKTYDKTTN